MWRRCIFSGPFLIDTRPPLTRFSCWYAGMLVWKGLENETTEASNGDKTHCVRRNHVVVTVVCVGAIFPGLFGSFGASSRIFPGLFGSFASFRYKRRTDWLKPQVVPTPCPRSSLLVLFKWLRVETKASSERRIWGGHHTSGIRSIAPLPYYCSS